jgi:hypothetical protein
MSDSTRKKGVVADTAGTGSKPVRHADENGRKVQMTRRMFMRRFSAGTAAIALTACGGGGSVPVPQPTPAPSPAPAPAPSSKPVVSNPPPVWSAVPTITFTQGVASTISIAAYVSDTQPLAISKNSAGLPAGVTYNAATKSFVYDGIGAVGMTDGHVLTAVEA